jgi:hypothetical protein
MNVIKNESRRDFQISAALGGGLLGAEELAVTSTRSRSRSFLRAWLTSTR